MTSKVCFSTEFSRRIETYIYGEPALNEQLVGLPSTETCYVGVGFSNVSRHSGRTFQLYEKP